MTPRSDLKIVFMATPEFAIPTLDIIIDNGYDVAAVVTVPDKPAGRGQKIHESAIKSHAVSKGLRVLQPEKLKDPLFLEELTKINADLFIVLAFRMLPEVVWSMPRLGTFNLHASLLPQYRGAAPINWAIINGESESGLTTFLIDKEIDTGKILMREKIAIPSSYTAGDLHDEMMIKGARLVLDTIRLIESGNANPIPQDNEISDENQLKHAPKILKETCKINWNQKSEIIQNHIRGLSPYPAAWTEIKSDKEAKYLKIFNTTIIIEEHRLKPGTVLTDNKKYFKIATKDGYLNIERLQEAGKKTMNTEDWLRGIRLNDNYLAE